MTFPAETAIRSNPESQGVQPVAILVVDDEPGMRNFLSKSLQNRCALLEVADGVATAEALRQRFHFDLLIVDIRLKGESGVEWVADLRERGLSADVIVMTAYADLDTAIAALRAGAADFILKPFRLEQMTAAVRRCLERRRISRENFLLRRELGRDKIEGILGSSRVIQDLREIVQRIAPTGATILLEGETGTGKELIARAIHELSGRIEPFVPVNCGSISVDLLESELFGHTKGAFTGAHTAREGLFSHARGGTLFLDEIGELPLTMQSKLLRVLEERKVRAVGADRETPIDVRVIAATNKHLAEEVAAGRFREDLYFRLNVVTLEAPPLRERLDDLPELAEYFGSAIAGEMGTTPLLLTHADMVQLQRYAWPGNVRELRNVIERSLLLGKLPHDCFPEGRPNAATNSTPPDWNLAQVERDHITQVLTLCEGNKSEAARRLGVSRKTLERKAKEWSS